MKTSLDRLKVLVEIEPELIGIAESRTNLSGESFSEYINRLVDADISCQQSATGGKRAEYERKDY